MVSKKIIKTVLNNQEAPADLYQLLNSDGCSDVLEEMECQLIKPEELPDLISHSYLNDDDRKDPDIMANVAAIDDVFKLITFVVQKDDGEIVGYWHGPEHLSLLEAPIVQYDTEGQFDILLGKTLTEAMLGVYVFDEDDEFLELREEFKQCGIEIQASNYDELHKPNPSTSPDSLHNILYNKYREKAGLSPM